MLPIHILLDENHLYEEAVNICIDKAKVFFNEHKQNHKLDDIIFYVNNINIIMEQANFYKKTLFQNGFISDNSDVFYLK